MSNRLNNRRLKNKVRKLKIINQIRRADNREGGEVNTGKSCVRRNHNKNLILCRSFFKILNQMKKLIKNSEYALYFLLCVVVGIVMSWLLIGYLQLELNPMNWSENLRKDSVFIAVGIIALSLPIAGIFDTL